MASWTKPYPRLVAMDLDGTVWNGWLNEHWFGRRGWVTQDKKEDNVEMICWHGDMILRDKLNREDTTVQCVVSRDIPIIIQDLWKWGVLIAISSRNTNKNMTNRALWYIKVRDSRDNIEKPLTDFLSYIEVEDVSKMRHFDRIKGWSGVAPFDMAIIPIFFLWTWPPLSNKKLQMLFDDKSENVDVEWWQGVTFIKVKDNRVGMTWSDYNDGLDRWRRYNAIRYPIPQNHIWSSRAQHIGYIGADHASAMRYAAGKRRLKSNRPARWGHGQYVTDDPRIAEFFSRWGREDQPQNQWVVALYTRDFGAFMAMDKVWIPERGTFLQINNMNQTEAATARAQERLDSRIQDEFGVRSPFILFCRHRRMSGMTFLGDGERFNEMVLYPNVQDAMFFGVAVPLAEAVAKRHGHEWGRKQWHSRLTAWGIRHIDETRNEFKYHMEGVM